jgi:hypothetical protein
VTIAAFCIFQHRIEAHNHFFQARLQSLGTKPIEHTLSLLRQLKYTESALLTGGNLYADDYDSNLYPSYLDLEMILLDIL